MTSLKKFICLNNAQSTGRSDKETVQNFKTCSQIINPVKYLRRITFWRQEILFIIYFVKDFQKLNCAHFNNNLCLRRRALRARKVACNVFDSRCQSFTAQWCISPSLREALLDARRDTVTHRATSNVCQIII